LLLWVGVKLLTSAPTLSATKAPRRDLITLFLVMNALQLQASGARVDDPKTKEISAYCLTERGIVCSEFGGGGGGGRAAELSAE